MIHFSYRVNPELLEAIKNKKLSEEEVRVYKKSSSEKQSKNVKMMKWLFGLSIVMFLIIAGIVYIGGDDLANQMEDKIIMFLLAFGASLIWGLAVLSKFIAYREILRAIKTTYPNLSDE